MIICYIDYNKIVVVVMDLRRITFEIVKKYFLKFAGAVLANRLTEVDDWSVLLIEAGGDETELSDVPLLAAYLQLTQLDWQYKAEPQETACLGE